MAQPFIISMKIRLDASDAESGAAAARAAIGTITGSAANANKPLQLNQQQLANVQYQLHDIATGLLSGQSPFTVMTQQGLQLTQVFGEGQGLMGVLKAVGGGIVGFLSNPLTLAVFGIAAASTAVGALWQALTGSGELAAERALQRHKQWVEEIAAAYPKAEAALKRYQDAARNLPRGVALDETTQQIAAYQGQLKEATATLDHFAWQIDRVANQAGLSSTDRQMQDLLHRFQQGEISVTDLRNGLAQIHISSDMSASTRRFLEDLQGAAGTAAQLWNNLFGAKAVLAEIQNADVSAAIDAATGRAVAALQQLKDLAPDIRTDRQKAADALSVALGSAPDALTRQAALSQYDKTVAAIDAQAAATRRLTEQRKADAAAARAQSEADQHLAAIKALNSDTAFNRSQLFRSPVEQQVAATLRPVFGDDLTSTLAQAAAGQIRLNEALQQTDALGLDITTGFLSTLKADLLQGTGLWGALADAGINALDKIASKALDMAANGIWDWIFGTGTDNGHGGVLGGIVSWLGGGIGHNAAGTDFWRGGLTAVNENGGEIIDLPSGTRIIPHDVSMKTAATGGGAVHFSPTTVIDARGSSMSQAQFQALLDARDEKWRAQLPDMMARANQYPWRRG